MVKKFFFIALICLFIVMILALNWVDEDIGGISTQNEGNTIGPITQNNSVEQTFISEENGLTRIDILLTTYGRVNTSNVFFEISDQQGNSFFSQTVNASDISDNAFFALDFDTIEDSEGKMYKISVFSDSQGADNAITAWASGRDLYTDGQLFLNGNAVDFDVSLRTYYSSKILSRQLVLFAASTSLSSIIIAVVYNLVLAKKTGKAIKFSCWIVCALILALSLTAAYNKGMLDLTTVGSVFSASGLLRILLFFMPSLLYTSFLFFNHEKIGDFLFYKRWVIAGVIFVITVACDLNLSNISMWNEYVQPNTRTELSEPIVGVKRAIRSDEWLCGTPWLATGELVEYGAENKIVRGTYNSGLAASGLYLSYSALSDPFKWGYYLFGFEYGTSFYWMSSIILSFMLAFELCYIIARGKKQYALFGGVLIGLSQFILWWSINVIWVVVPAIIVCIYYYCEAETKGQKILLALGVALSCSTFIVRLYPAWQVPLAYFMAAVVIWIIIEKWSKIKHFRRFDWITVAGAFLFMVSVVACYFYDDRFYVEQVANTVYPGHRVSNGGEGWMAVFNRALLFPQTLLYPVKSIGNPCELGVIFSLFPIPIIVAFSNLLYQIYQKKKKNIKVDTLNISLLIAAVFIYVYCAEGFPEWLAKITLMNYSTTTRAEDILIYICALLMIRGLAAERRERLKFPFWVVLGVSSFIAIYSIRTSNTQVLNYMPIEYIVFITICILALSFALFNTVSNKVKNGIVLTGTVGIALCGLAINPITRGVEALKSKPAALAIQEIVSKDPDAKWASLNMGQYIVANGGSCITSVNYVPNMDLWTKLDPEGKYNEVYNRYAHVGLNLTHDETSFTLLTADSMLLNLNYSDMEKCEIKYLTASSLIHEDSEDVDFELLYNEDNFCIYRVIYL